MLTPIIAPFLMKRHFLFLALLFSLVFSSLFSQEKEEVFLHGHLGDDAVFLFEEKVEQWQKREGGRVVVRINSSSGDLQSVLKLAQHLYELRVQYHKVIVVYIQEKAIGPAAILPFLADELIVTPAAIWGDIPYGTRGEMRPSLLRATVKGFIDQNSDRVLVLKQVLDAMVDSQYQLIYDRQKEKDGGGGGLLILHVQGMESLGLVDRVMGDEELQLAPLDPRGARGERSSVYEGVGVVSAQKLHEMFKTYLSYSKTEKNLIGSLFIEKERPINQATYIYVKFALDDYKKKGVRFVILHLDTPGGEVLWSLKIANLLQKLDLKDHIPVIALIDDWAISAGAMLAYSCRFIGVTPSSIMGAAEPVLLGQGGKMEPASEKMNSALRAEFASLASFYGRNPLVAQAMVDKDLILVIRNHEIISLHSESELITTGHDPDQIITTKGKLLTLGALELTDLGVVDFEVPVVAPLEVTEKERQAHIWPAEKSLLFQESYLSKIPRAFIISHQDWRIDFFTFLSHPLIASILLIGLVVGLYIEINTPGFGVPGLIGLSCLALILLSSFASQAVNWIEVVILIAGLLLLALELFVIPGFGIPGILGIILTIVGLFALMLPGISQLSLFDVDTFALVGITLLERLAWFCGAIVFSVVVIVFLAKVFSHRFFRFSHLILKGEQEAKAGYVSGISRDQMPQAGEVGETLTPLRPSGKVHIGDNLFDGMTQGGYLDAHIAVEVIRVEGSKVIVRSVKEEVM